ncbi:hypothetical protein [Lacinutrix salivirga]
MTDILKHLVHYLSSLDWEYIFTFIIIAFGLNQKPVTDWLADVTGIKIKTRYRVLIVGFIYGVIIYFIRDTMLHKVEMLLQSFVFALVFHKLILESILNRLFKPEKTEKDE